MDATSQAGLTPADGHWVFRTAPAARVAGGVAATTAGPSGRGIIRLAEAFTAAECLDVLKLAAARPFEWGIHTGIDISRRLTRVRWLPPASETRWLYEKLESIFLHANAAFGFDLTGFSEDLQFVEYRTGMHFDWHVDSLAQGLLVRKLSLSLQLSEQADYDGGGLEFLRPGQELVLSRRLGTAIVFPAFMSHRVTRVKRGRRCALVAWAAGPPFR
jgi:PKHD-type hydroxylase